MARTAQAKDAYKIVILKISDKDVPAEGIFSGQSAVSLLNKYAEDGYTLFAVGSYKSVPSQGHIPSFYEVMYTFKLNPE